MSRIHSKSARGFALMGILLAVGMLASMGILLSVSISANQKTRISTNFSSQAFYLSHGALEYAMRQAIHENNCNPTQRYLFGVPFQLNTSGNLTATVDYGKSDMIASRSFSVDKPSSGGNSTRCISTLGTSGTSITLTGTASLNLDTCGVVINSTSSQALKMTGTSSLTMSSTDIVGSYSASGNTNINGTVNTNATGAPDPMQLLPGMPSYTECTHNNFSISGSGTLSPGVYCNGLNISGSGTVNLEPGNYIIDGGQLNVSGSADINAPGVTFFLNRQIASSYATLNISGSGEFNLTAPTNTDNPYAGVAIYQSRSATSGPENKVTGSAGANIEGVIYIPNQSIKYAGTPSSNAPCTLIVAQSATFHGNANVSCKTGDLNGWVDVGGC